MSVESVDVLVVGAGISGIGAGYRLMTECPAMTYAILEGRGDLGGTWDLFRYPGVRSDSDMFTLSYPFHPWRGAESIASGESILAYVRSTAEAYGIDRHIRFNHRVTRASWSSATSRWTVDVDRGDDAGPVQVTCRFLYLCSGYYRYDAGYMPVFPGIERFDGPVIHPQQWPENLDLRGKRVVVIGSGATAVTLVPALANDAAHVTMLQRSPSYILSLPGRDALADALRKRLPARLAHRLVRWKNVLSTTVYYQLCRRRPALARRLLRAGVQRLLPADVALDPHFDPAYDPWDQRLCIVPDGDLFTALGSGRASIVTDQIETFTERGIQLVSGTELEADIVISATGLTLAACGGISIDVDDTPVDPAQCFAYKGFLLSGIPNLAFCVGYTNASWTLRADLTSRSVCRLLNHMDRHGFTRAVPVLAGAPGERRPVLDLTSGYIQRGLDMMPKQGSKAPWKLPQNYLLDVLSTRFSKIDQSLELSRQAAPRAAPDAPREPEPVA
ncbi:MAG: FAD-containing monooxygenase EthA [Acidimicrobiales bacterium]|nr:FAD-containing monooxygenase EthA [Acidimicrobiales bacterium]